MRQISGKNHRKVFLIHLSSIHRENTGIKQ